MAALYTKIFIIIRQITDSLLGQFHDAYGKIIPQYNYFRPLNACYYMVGNKTLDNDICTLIHLHCFLLKNMHPQTSRGKENSCRTWNMFCDQLCGIFVLSFPKSLAQMRTLEHNNSTGGLIADFIH